jgi:ribosomal protein S18 acetylase RimI-like enzyme
MRCALSNAKPLELCVRTYQPDDYTAVAAIWTETRQRPFSAEQIARVLRIEGGALIAEVTLATGERRIAGILLWTHNTQRAFLWRVAVSCAFRKQGIATAMLAQAERDIEAAGLDRIGLFTRVRNTPAKALYSKHGYRPLEDLEYWSKSFSADTPPVPCCASEADSEEKE